MVALNQAEVCRRDCKSRDDKSSTSRAGDVVIMYALTAGCGDTDHFNNSWKRS